MSEYQFYEFRAVDRPLTSQEMASLRAISSRAEITPTSFVNTYNYADFRGDSEALVAECFDAFVYVANWGTHEFILRLPKQALDRRDYAPFCTRDCLRAWLKGDYSEPEGSDVVIIRTRASSCCGRSFHSWMRFDALVPAGRT